MVHIMSEKENGSDVVERKNKNCSTVQMKTPKRTFYFTSL